MRAQRWTWGYRCPAACSTEYLSGHVQDFQFSVPHNGVTSSTEYRSHATTEPHECEDENQSQNYRYPETLNAVKCYFCSGRHWITACSVISAKCRYPRDALGCDRQEPVSAVSAHTTLKLPADVSDHVAGTDVLRSTTCCCMTAHRGRPPVE